MVEGLRACHSTGIVHRDVKPQNVIVCGEEQCAKMIDLGAAADLRVGINYVPNEFLLDPRYAPPEQYIMSTQVQNTRCQNAPSLHGYFFGFDIRHSLPRVSGNPPPYGTSYLGL